MADTSLETIVSLAKRRGFIFQGSDIYGGLAGTWDYGPLGVALKNNIKKLWWRMFVESRDDMYGIDAAILMNPKAWEASGHVAGFSDPLVECNQCRRRFREDHVNKKFIKNTEGKILEGQEIWVCENCGKENGISEARQFNMMFETYAGPVNPLADVYAAFSGLILRNEKLDVAKAGSLMEGLDNSRTYLRPETAGGIFVNFKNVVDAFHPKLPFGIAQIGKAFRNEIAPRDFIFRVRELEQMEVEYFVHPGSWSQYFEEWRALMSEWTKIIGIDSSKLHEVEIPDGERAHYSRRTIDFEFEYPFGQKELYGLAYRTDFDLSAHAAASGVDLSYHDELTGERFVPHVIEPSLGVDRTILAVLLSAYREDTMGDDTRSYLAFKPAVAPVKVAVFPLLRNKPELVVKAKEIYRALKVSIPQVLFDDNGNIGKRYRLQDEIGTPWCVTIDFETLENDTVTVRDRDSGAQERISVGDLVARFSAAL